MDGDKKAVRVFELLAYLASSARGLLEEPREYGPLRCLDAMRRLIDMVLETGLIEDEEVTKYLEELRSRLSQGIILLMYSAEEFRKFIINVNVELSEKTTRVLERYYNK